MRSVGVTAFWVYNLHATVQAVTLSQRKIELIKGYEDDKFAH
jgi:hypothetical protein